jgi:hypothetical protein
MSPTARTLALLRREGFTAGVVERWLPYAGVRSDLFGCMDLVAVRRHEPGVLGIQATTAANLATRLKKAKQQPELRTWLAAGNQFAVFAWHKREGRWQVKRVSLRAGDLAEVPPDPAAGAAGSIDSEQGREQRKR